MPYHAERMNTLAVRENARKFAFFLLLMTAIGLLAGGAPFARYAAGNPLLLTLGVLALAAWGAAVAGLLRLRRWGPPALLLASAPFSVTTAFLAVRYLFDETATGSDLPWYLGFLLLFYIVLAYLLRNCDALD